MRLITLISPYLAVSLLLGACTSPPRRPPPPPAEIVSAPVDKAVVYFFRPEIDVTGENASPELLVDARSVARIPRISYTFIELEPGEHTVALIPTNEAESKWSAHARFSVEAGNVYYTAIWNQAQPSRSGATVVVPIAGQGVFIPIFLGPGKINGTVTFEVVAPDIGKDSLSGLYKVAPLAYTPAVR